MVTTINGQGNDKHQLSIGTRRVKHKMMKKYTTNGPNSNQDTPGRGKFT
jgi:hypothetical protein